MNFGGPFGLAWAGGNLAALQSVTLIDTPASCPDTGGHTLARIWRTPLLR